MTCLNYFSKIDTFSKCFWGFSSSFKGDQQIITHEELPVLLPSDCLSSSHLYIHSGPKNPSKMLYILPERHVTHFRRIWGWYFKCVFWLLKSIKLYVLNIRDGAELESLNCLKAHDFSRFWHQLVSDRLVTLSSPEDVSKPGVCVRSFKIQVLNLYI